jgi:ferric-dicitrate binding protein FerR (iron transport regulator)
VTTPRGGIFKLTLSDGTNVWLNSASSIRFPVAFSDKERIVEVTGEVYFEVAKQVIKGNPVPFFCKAGNMEVAVLGTHFNINAYSNETAVKTTLLEGAVKVKQGANTKLLLPGQQSLVGKDGQITLSDQVNLDEVMGWKNGFFVFEEANIGQIMREVERWYNLDVEYDGPLPDARFNGRISRKTNVSQMMKVLALSGINFRITGNKIIIKSR